MDTLNAEEVTEAAIKVIEEAIQKLDDLTGHSPRGLAMKATEAWSHILPMVRQKGTR